jgi:hypothetical protein
MMCKGMNKVEGRKFFCKKQNLIHAFKMQDVNKEKKVRNCTLNIMYRSFAMSYVDKTWEQVCIYTHFNVTFS